MAKTIKRLLAGLLAILLLFAAPASSFEAAAASMPGLNAKITEKSILKILNRYDTDGAYILKKRIQAGDNVLSWFTGGRRIIEGIDTAVHEETHAYSFQRAHWNAYFVGKKKTIHVPVTTVYYTKKMASSIPARLRTFRYNTYVAKPTANLASNIEGAYGLLNEFMAYRSGMNTTISLYPYYVAQKAGWESWRVFLNSCENDKLAYAEFKYYILHYLSYAKKHYPKVYKGILNNKKFCQAYRTLESSYVKLINTYEKDLKKIQKLMKKQGRTMEITESTIWISTDPYSKTGMGRYTADYKKLQKEIKKSAYTSIHKKLVAKGKG